jgi:hypothetical protein
MSASVRLDLDLIRLCRLLDGVRWSSEPSHTCLSRLANAKIRSSPRIPNSLQKSGRLCISRRQPVESLGEESVHCNEERHEGSNCGLGWKRGPKGPPKKIAKSTPARSRVHPTFSTNARAYRSQIRKVIAVRAVTATSSYTASMSCIVDSGLQQPSNERLQGHAKFRPPFLLHGFQAPSSVRTNQYISHPRYICSRCGLRVD